MPLIAYLYVSNFKWTWDVSDSHEYDKKYLLVHLS